MRSLSQFRHRWGWLALVALMAFGGPASVVVAQEKPADKPQEKKPEKKFPEWEEVVKGTTKLPGLLPLYFDEKEQKLFMEISADKYERDFICPIAIARGAGRMYLGGDTLNFGDQWVLSFRRVADRILVIRRNVYFKASSGSPQADAVKVSYNDSVIAALPVKSEQHEGKQVLVDLADLFMTDLANIGIMPDRARSTWGKVKAYPENVEIEVNAVSARGMFSFFFGQDESIPDARGTQVVVHYGLSLLPSEGSYKPRLADDRVGHFLSVVKDFSSDLDQTAFQRYVTRWKLEKNDESAEKSPPKEPIIFWIEKTVPREYRPYVKAGILEWNKAFEKIGFLDAIQVRDQQAGDDFEPEDIRYNTFRWITTSSSFAMGPSRTNPRTGQILDADIVFDESMVRYWRSDFLQLVGVPQGFELLATGQRQAWFRIHAADIPWIVQSGTEAIKMRQRAEAMMLATQQTPESEQSREWRRRTLCKDGCMLGTGMSRQMGLMAAILQAQGKAPGGKIPEEYIGQGIKEVVMHEVGHTLGLRHNFKASTMLSLADANNPEITRAKGMAGSVMDYLPANFVTKDQKQGDYFSTTIGPYDYWAIEYAYSPVKGDEKAELAKIAAKLAEPGHDFGTDEDLYANPDPRINLFDLGDPLEFSKQRAQLVRESLQNLAERVVENGEGWQRARTAFGNLLGELANATVLAVEYVGAEYSHRDHRGDPNARLPFEAIPAEKQRQAIRFVQDNVFADKAFDFSPDLLNKLAPEHFRHWGLYGYNRQPVRVYDQILALQQIALSRLLDGDVLARVQNAELQAKGDADVVRMPEIFDSVTSSIWSEIPKEDQTVGKDSVTISTVRRNLQREHVRKLSRLVLGPKDSDLFYFFEDYSEDAPADAKSLARLHLKRIDAGIERVLKANGAGKDPYTLAHLEELHQRIGKVLDASLELSNP
ncbi:MAG: zinc-dependent metalloprotease [Planctomycetota bacterium]